MSTDIGTLYITQIPALTDAADIQSAFKLYHYGTTSTPTDPANLIANSVAGNLHRIDDTAVFLAGTQTITGTKTFSAALTASSTLTVSGTMTTNGNTVIGSDNTDTLTVNAVSTFAGNSTFSGNLNANGNVTIGNASTDTVTINSNALTYVNRTNFIIPATANNVAGITFKTSTGDGLSIGGLDSATSSAIITPWRSDSSQDNSQIYYNFTANQWTFEPNVKVLTDFLVDGNTTIGTHGSDTLTVNAVGSFVNGATSGYTFTAGDSSTQIATTAFVSNAINNFSKIQFFGDGSDGNVTISGNTSLTRDMFYNNLTIASTGKLATNGYRVFVAGTLDVTAAVAGAISHNFVTGKANSGANGVAGSGTQTAGGAASESGPLAGMSGSTGGATGSTSPGSGTAGANIANTTQLFPYGIAVGTNGMSGSGSTGTPGAGGEWTAPTKTFGIKRAWIDTQYIVTSAGGLGGGSGTPYTASTAGAGGGGGAGCYGLAIYANIINRGSGTGTGFINMQGGNGGNGALGTNTGGYGGGGSGGQGGLVYIVYGTLTGTSKAAAIKSTGGTGGNGQGSAAGATGGYSGAVILVNLVSGTLSYTAPVAGSAGTISGNAGGAGGVASVTL